MRSYRTSSDKAVLNPKSRVLYSAMLLVALKSRCTIYLNCSSCGSKSSTPAPAPFLHEEPSKKRVQWGPVKIGALGSGSLTYGPPWVACWRRPVNYEVD
jgi:rRNA maturation protein Nop10